MRTYAEKLGIAALLCVPVVIAIVGWPVVLNWIAPAPEQPKTEEAASAAATMTSTAPTVVVTAPTRAPTVVAEPTPAPTVIAESTRATTQPVAQPAQSAPISQPNQPTVTVAQPTQAASGARPVAASTATPVPVQRPSTATTAQDPSRAVAEFYSLVAQHDFGDAAQLWSPRMQATFPPRENIDQRFSATRALSLRRADVISQNTGQAAVAVDLMESSGGSSRHWVGTWYLVRGPNGWLLDQPQLSSE